MNSANVGKGSFFSVKDIASTGLLVAFITVCSYMSVQMVVPFTLQILAIFLVIYLQGPVKSLITISIYVLMGVAGLPVFANFNGGVPYLLGPTGGFVMGFLFMPLCYLPFYRMKKSPMLWFILSMVIALLVLYAFGTFWFIAIYKHGDAAIWNVLNLTVVPFILPDLAKLAVACLLGMRLKRILRNVV